jgi:hypothetical protein
MQTLKAQVGPTGLRKWQLPDSELSIIWPGPGAGLMLCVDRPGGLMTSIRSNGSDGQYSTAKEAQKAVDTFVSKAVANG